MKEVPRSALDARRNQLLAALPDADWERLQPHLQRADLRLGQMLCVSGTEPASVYFPTTAIVSLLYRTTDGSSAEIGVVGNDGVVGFSLFMGGNATPGQAVVQSAGHGYRLPSHIIKSEVLRGGPMLHLLLRYTQALIVQISHTAVCNRYHAIDQQLSRRLLMGLDRLPSDELAMTQEQLAGLLGVRREGVTAAAMKLQQAGAIRYSRGHISVLDRNHLEQRSCECYAAAKREYERLLPNSANPIPMAA